MIIQRIDTPAEFENYPPGTVVLITSESTPEGTVTDFLYLGLDDITKITETSLTDIVERNLNS